MKDARAIIAWSCVTYIACRRAERLLEKWLLRLYVRRYINRLLRPLTARRKWTDDDVLGDGLARRRAEAAAFKAKIANWHTAPSGGHTHPITTDKENQG